MGKYHEGMIIAPELNVAVLKNLLSRTQYIQRASKIKGTVLMESLKNNLAYVAHVLLQAMPRKAVELIPGTNEAEEVDELCRACIELARKFEMTRQELLDRAPVVYVGPGLFD